MEEITDEQLLEVVKVQKEFASFTLVTSQDGKAENTVIFTAWLAEQLLQAWHDNTTLREKLENTQEKLRQRESPFNRNLSDMGGALIDASSKAQDETIRMYRQRIKLAEELIQLGKESTDFLATMYEGDEENMNPRIGEFRRVYERYYALTQEAGK